MHTKELARAFRAFAGLAEFERSQEIYRFSAFIEQGSNETVLSRLKRVSASTSYPLRLKESLEAMELGFKSVGATKQANALGTILKLFAGRPGATIEGFITEISVSPQATDLRALRFKAADFAFAKLISDQLSESSLDPRSFESIMAKLRSSDAVKTATLALIANLYAGNGRIYRDRKMALDAIDKHFRVQASRARETCDAPG
jgi:hypothetical protein